MPRLRGRARLLDPLTDLGHVHLELHIGPHVGGVTVDELQLAWELHQRDVMRDYQGPPATRPWAFWKFTVGENRPRDWHGERVRLAELGLLRRDEVAALREAATEALLRVGTPRERVSGGSLSGTDPRGVSLDRRTVETWDRVEERVRVQRTTPDHGPVEAHA